MNQVINLRLRKLEAVLAPTNGRAVHRVIAATDDEANGKMAAMIASGRAASKDMFIFGMICGTKRA